MEIRSILVNVDIGAPGAAALRYAIDLATRFDASLIGVGADQPNMAYAGWAGDTANIDLYSMERGEIEAQLKQAEEAFQTLVPSQIARVWHGYVTDRTRALVDTARGADLIVTASTTSSALRQQQQVTDLGSLVLAAGRPVIDVASSATSAGTETICIGWKDTREARRAVSDALPLLKQAREVVAFTVSEGAAADERASLDDLLVWLKSHDVAARGDVLDNPGGYGDVLETNAVSLKADLLVIGGYGHSRAREWLFGGVTRSVLSANSLNRFLSN